MTIEIERKFLVKDDSWKSLASGKSYRQGYILTQDKVTTIRVRTMGNQAYLTIKSKTQGMSRHEFEYPIPIADAQIILDNLCHRPLIEKIRYKIPVGNLVWEVDEFKGENQGLILAEVELQAETQAIEFPNWVGEEVTHDPKYYNVNLAKTPYQSW